MRHWAWTPVTRRALLKGGRAELVTVVRIAGNLLKAIVLIFERTLEHHVPLAHRSITTAATATPEPLSGLLILADVGLLAFRGRS